MDVFKKRYYLFNMYLSLINVVSYLLSIPISFYLWGTGVNECFDLLLYSMIYIVRCFYAIYHYNLSFLDTFEGQESPDNPHGFREIVYKRDEVEQTDPRLLDETCSICIGDYEEGDKIFEFKCIGGHYFHQDCLNKWMGQKNTCPLCKKFMDRRCKTQNQLICIACQPTYFHNEQDTRIENLDSLNHFVRKFISQISPGLHRLQQS